MFFRIVGRACLVAMALLVFSCGGQQMLNQPAPGPLVPILQAPTPDPVLLITDRALVTVRMQPQAPLDQPIRELSWSKPTALTSLLPQLKQFSWLPEDLLKSASDYEPALPSQLTDNTAPPAATFSPTWDASGNPTAADLSYAMYRFALEDYDQEPSQTIGFTWVIPPANYANFFVGLGNVDQDSWDWFAGPADDVLTIASFTPYIAPDGNALLAVVFTGTDECTLEQIQVGETELRSLGGLDEDVVADDTPPLSGGSLPARIDLTPGCSPVNDQGQVGSCTSFAIADGAYNYELKQIYGDYGWDFTDPFNLVSPKYLYIETGKAQGFGCPGEGRYLTASTAWLQDNGIATELNAPYGFANPPFPNWCNDNWSAAALADAALLDIDSFSSFSPATPTGVLNIKTILANQERPVIIGIGLDDGFLNYQSGTWNFAGPLVGYHAMLIVGYDDALDGGNGAFKVRNSWSEHWGEDGYVWIGYNTLINYPADQYIWCNTVRDEYNADVADRFLGIQAELAPPTGVSASDGDYADRIYLAWERSLAATGYMIYRDSKSNMVGLLGDVSEWSDTEITDQLGHVYWVKAYTPTLQSELSMPDVGYLGEMPVISDITPTSGIAGAEITFSANVSGSSPLTYSWSFGGCAIPNTSNNAAPQVTLVSTPGDYSVSLTVSNDLGSDQYDFTFTVDGLFRELLIVYNSDMPEDLDLTDYYSSPATGRAIDPAYRLGLPLGAEAAQTINRELYGSDIRDPIIAFIDDPGNAEIKANIKYLLMMKGVPYRIPGTNGGDHSLSTNTCVDSELCMLRNGDAYRLEGPVWSGAVYQDFTGTGWWQAGDVDFEPDTYPLADLNGGSWTLNYLVGRITAYTYENCKQMIDRSLAADTSGEGWIILDTKPGSIVYETMFDPVWPTDNEDWDSGFELLTAAAMNVHGDETSDRMTWDYAGLPAGAADYVLAHCNWGVHAGFTKTYILDTLGFTYPPGSCFISYESINGVTMRCTNPEDPSEGHPSQGQIADFIYMGGTVAIGNVYEPWTDGCGDERWVFDRYVHHGDRWIEAAYKGLYYVSWQEVVIGDPLCRVVAD